MKKKFIGLMVAFLGVLSLGLATAPQASAATYDEIYGCSGSTASGTWAGTCNGVWYAGTPGTRTAKMYLDLVTVSSQGYRNTELKTVSTTDGRKKVYQWRCLHDDFTTTGLLGTTTVGGGLANSFTWTNGYNPCAGYQGLQASIVATYGSSTYTTVVYINAPKDYYPHAWRGVQRTA